jgi:Na+-transporting methylmalonyl-CoA/oxaloacetate decarboxylase gamma subunit
MTNILLQGLAIAGIGMGLVFLMIFALWGIMALLVLLTTRTTPQVMETAEQPSEPPSELPVETHHRAEAAAAAVAFALAQERTRQQQELKAGTEPTSQWLLTSRLQQINRGSRGRRG